MALNLKDIVYESGKYWVLKVEHGFDVYKTGITHSTRCAQIGESLGLERAIQEIERRQTEDKIV